MEVSTDEAPVAWQQLEKDLTHSIKKYRAPNAIPTHLLQKPPQPVAVPLLPQMSKVHTLSVVICTSLQLYSRHTSFNLLHLFEQFKEKQAPPALLATWRGTGRAGEERKRRARLQLLPLTGRWLLGRYSESVAEGCCTFHLQHTAISHYLQVISSKVFRRLWMKSKERTRFLPLSTRPAPDHFFRHFLISLHMPLQTKGKERPCGSNCCSAISNLSIPNTLQQRTPKEVSILQEPKKGRDHAHPS